MRRDLVGATLAQVLAMRGQAISTIPKTFIPTAPPPMSIKKKKKKVSVPIVTPQLIEFKSKESEGTKPAEAKPEEKKSEEKKDKKLQKKMKKWPEDDSALIDYPELVGPLKNIITQGYRLFRKDQEEFDYEGFNIGTHELQHFPPPKYRFTKELLAFDDKRGRKLIDVVLHVMFLLGVEQGRRAERKDAKPMEIVLQTMDKYRDHNKNLRLKIDELEITLKLKNTHPELTDEALKQAVIEGVKQRRNIRLFEAKKELGIDPVRSAFEFKATRRVKFRDLEKLAKSLNKDICTLEQWEDLLKERGWTYEEWKSTCKRKFVRIDFT